MKERRLTISPARFAATALVMFLRNPRSAMIVARSHGLFCSANLP